MPMTPRFKLRNIVVAAGIALALCAGPAQVLAKTAAKAKKTQKVVKKAQAQDSVGEFANFSHWKEVAAFIDEMVAKHGFDKPQLEATLNLVRYVDTTIQLIKPAPPGKPKNWQAYSKRFIEPQRIAAGVQFWEQNAPALALAEQRYGVPAEIIVGIIGVETFYGRNTGNFRVMDALTTLAFAYPNTPTREARMTFFRGELENVLLLAREANMDPFDLRGSYAGAIGWPQFMPSSIRQYAVDFDGDGKIDLRNSQVDAIGSVANFLVQHGWQSGAPAVYPARVLNTSDTAPWTSLVGRGIAPELKRDSLINFGIASTTEIPIDLPLGLIDLQNGTEATEYWLGGNNFFTITKYNRSYFYAMSVVDLGRAIRLARSGQ